MCITQRVGSTMRTLPQAADLVQGSWAASVGQAQLLFSAEWDCCAHLSLTEFLSAKVDEGICSFLLSIGPVFRENKADMKNTKARRLVIPIFSYYFLVTHKMVLTHWNWGKKPYHQHNWNWKVIRLKVYKVKILFYHSAITLSKGF